MTKNVWTQWKWSKKATVRSPEQLFIDLFAQHQRFAVYYVVHSAMLEPKGQAFALIQVLYCILDKDIIFSFWYKKAIFSLLTKIILNVLRKRYNK